MQPRVAGILLAAGEGSRLGQPKALVEIAGQRLVDRGLLMLRAGGADPVVVVTGAAPVDVPGALVVHNPAWPTGMGSSLTAGLSALRTLPPDECSAAVIALADQPLVSPECVKRLIAAHRGDAGAAGGRAGDDSPGAGGAPGLGAAIAVAAYGGRPRNPVLIAREHWAEVLTLARGDAGARPFLRAHPDLVTLVECADTGRPDDVDTPEDLSRVAKIAAQPNLSWPA
jgi:CTP:molybdopterin cytidylyltransferase MocA